MNIIKHLLSKSLTSIVAVNLLLLTCSMPISATIVVFDTSQGSIEVNLFDESTPQTVNNFLSYVNDGSYSNTIIHRNVDNFIVQGGGYSFDNEYSFTNVSTHLPVMNEPVWSNKRGSLAMAKIGNAPNSATNQWFFNLNDNSRNLDYQNGGFTVFGQVTTEGMAVVDKISELTTCDEYKVNSQLTMVDIVMPDYDCSRVFPPSIENFVTIYNVSISNPVIDTLTDLCAPETDVCPIKNIYVPALSVPSSLWVNKNQNIYLLGIKLRDVDAMGLNLTLSAENGVLSIGDEDDALSELVLSGRGNEINRLLSFLVYTPEQDFTGNLKISVVLFDGEKTSEKTINVTVNGEQSKLNGTINISWLLLLFIISIRQLTRKKSYDN